MSVRLPKNPIWKQNNYGDKFDDLWASYNLDLSSKWGSIKVSPRSILNVSSTDEATLGVPTAFEEFNEGTTTMFAIAGTKVWTTTGITTPFSAATGFNTTDYTSGQSDLEVYNGSLYATPGTTRNIYKATSAGVYSAIANGLASYQGIHAMVNFKAQNRLYFIDWYGTSIGSLDTTDTVVGTLGNQYSLLNLVDGITSYITWIKATSTRIYIGTLSPTSQRSKVFSWDGSRTGGANDYYELEAFGSLACVIKDDVPIVLDTFGKLWQLNGGTFTELGRLPYSYGFPIGGNIADGTTLMVHRNGMDLVNNKVTFLVNTQLNNGALEPFEETQENLPAGLWQYSKESGIVHIGSPGLAKTADAITDYGQRWLEKVGAILPTTMTGSTVEQGIVFGASYHPSSSTEVFGIFYTDYLDTKQKLGSLITSKMFSPNLSDTWQKLSVRLTKLLTSTDRLYVKYRTSETLRREFTATWTSTTSFTTTVDILTATPPYPAFAVGDEITVLSGVGAGKSAHITNIQVGATEWIVTLDETFTGATGTSIVHLQKWKKLTTLSDQTKDLFEVPVGQESTWIQFKIIFLAQYKDEISDIILSNVSNQPTT